MMHVSRMAEELVIWMSPRIGFIDIADRFCTGSSIMPQKKNPDVPELARGKTGRVYGHLIGLLTLMKGQPLAYNKDNQEDKEPLFDTVDTVIDTLRIFADMAGGITVKPEAMRAAALQGYATATDLADYLVKKGLPFRDAHEAVALAVRACVDAGCDLAQSRFPDTHAALTVQLLDIVRDTLGPRALDGIIAVREAETHARYEAALADRATLRDKIAALADLRSAEGYMAAWSEADDGTLTLVENHCPICAAATACQGFCRAELEVFRAVIGPGATVTREEHIVSGGRRCSYAIREVTP